MSSDRVTEKNFKTIIGHRLFVRVYYRWKGGAERLYGSVLQTFSHFCSRLLIRSRLTVKVYISTRICDHYRDFFVRARVVHESSSGIVVAGEVTARGLGESTA